MLEVDRLVRLRPAPGSPYAEKLEALGKAIRADYDRWLETENAQVTQLAGRPIGIRANWKPV